MKKMIIAAAVAVITATAAHAQAADFYAGGDMTEVNYIEDLGGVYKDFDDNPVDPFEFLAENGMNMARIRLSNTPGKGTGDGTYYLPEGFQDEKDCLDLSKRAKEAGMEIQFTFNYSDYWSNGERQIIPSEWVKAIKDDLGYDVKDPAFLKSMSNAQMTEIRDKLGDLVYDYTKEIMTKLKNQGTVPKYVSLGNEINGGMFFPFANTFDANMNSKRFELVYDSDKDETNDIKCYKNWSALAAILNRGYDAVKEVSPESEVVIHLANGSKDSVFTWFIDDYQKAGGKFDVIGASYYPAWSQNPIETCVSFCNNISKKYGKDILIMETGYNWKAKKKNGYDGQLTANAPGYNEKYPFTQEGQRDFLKDLFEQLQTVNDNRCVGVLYWDPCMIHVEDPQNENESLSGWALRESDDKPDGNVVENTTLFDFDGKAVLAVEAFRTTIKDDPGKDDPGKDDPGEDDPQKAELTGTYTDDTDKIIATVNNGLSEDKKVNLYVASYDANGALTGVKIDSKKVTAGSEDTLELNKPDGTYRVFLWNGETLAPIIK
ncbi:MAG: glycosyl hydrolase 53 family protein [Oscillospiraceae bacterium]|nr:glycosyl hydrolase 53 family protein [Oscillospiraceae bacterium]